VGSVVLSIDISNRCCILCVAHTLVIGDRVLMHTCADPRSLARFPWGSTSWVKVSSFAFWASFLGGKYLLDAFNVMDDMARYYNQHWASIPTFTPGDKVYLDSSDIQTTRPSMKLSHRHLGPYQVECSVRCFAYCLMLPHSMRCLHPVFNVIKLTPAPPDPIIGRHQTPPPPPELIDSEEEYVVEEILDSRMFHQKLQYFVEWEGYRIVNNSWEYWDNLGNAAKVVVDFHTRHPEALWHICATAFGTISFCTISPAFTLSQCSSRRGVIVRGNPLCYTLHHTANTYAHQMLIRPNASPLAAITPFCISSDLLHYFQTLCISLFTVYIRPCQQRDLYPFLFGSPASCAFIAVTHCGCPYITHTMESIYVPIWNDLGRVKYCE